MFYSDLHPCIKAPVYIRLMHTCTHTEMRTHRLYVILNSKKLQHLHENLAVRFWRTTKVTHQTCDIWRRFCLVPSSLCGSFFLLFIYTHLSLFHKNKFNICLLEVKVCCWITNVWITFIYLYITFTF